jgi:hypothetical protein
MVKLSSLLAALALAATASSSLAATPPGTTSATAFGPNSRAALGPLMDPSPPRPMPADANRLDTLLLGHQYSALYQRLAAPEPPAAVKVDMNWVQSRLYRTGAILLAFAFVNDLWRYHLAAPTDKPDQTRQTAVIVGLYAEAVIEMDRLTCGPFGPSRREAELRAQFPGVWAYGRTLPAATKSAMVGTAIEMEAATAPVRRGDIVLCVLGDGSHPAGAGIGSDLPAPNATWIFRPNDTLGGPDPAATLPQTLAGWLK